MSFGLTPALSGGEGDKGFLPNTQFLIPSTY